MTVLLNQVSFKVPPQKQRRHQIFTQHEKEGRSVMQQLDGLETLSGVFRVKLVETSDGKEWKLLAWVERQKKKRPIDAGHSKLVSAYIKSGRPPELLHQSLSNIQPLSDYETQLLAGGNVEVERNRRFFEVAKAILRESRFDELLAEAKGDELEGRKARKNPTARLIHRIMEAVGTPVATAKAAFGAR